MHVIIGSLALITFWLPLFTKKGSKNHKQFGKVFVYSMYVVAISGVIMTMLVLIDPIAVRFPDKVLTTEQIKNISYQNRVFSSFLFMLSILVFCSTRHAVTVLKVKADRNVLKTTSYLLPIVFLGFMGALMFWFGLKEDILLFNIFGGISFFVSLGMVRYIFKAVLKQREWLIEHLGSIFGAGIGVYTAFFAFGGSKIFSAFLAGNLQVVPWVVPSIIGLAASAYYSNKYRKQYRVEATKK
jgi:uncharacterized membrane protein